MFGSNQIKLVQIGSKKDQDESDKIASNWIKPDLFGSNWFKINQIDYLLQIASNWFKSDQSGFNEINWTKLDKTGSNQIK